MNDEQHAANLADAATAQAPWIFAALTTMLAAMWRFTLGRHLKEYDKVAEDVGDIRERVARIEGMLSKHDLWERKGRPHE